MKSKFIYFLLGALIVCNTSTFAQSTEEIAVEDLIGMSMEELMNITVETASKSNESVKDAPAVISIISAKEIEGYGAMSLGEVLDRATATYFNGTYYPKGNITIRGDHTAIYDTHVLFLINGRPLRESFNNGANYGALNAMFPIDVIKQIEILRGPGSVLYGTSAYTAVINIITKDGGKNSMKSFVRYGSFNTTQAGVSGTTALKGLKISGGINYLNSEGWDYTARDEKSVIRNQANTADSAFKEPITIPLAEQGIGTNLRLGYKGLTINSAYVYSDQRIMGRTPVWRNPIEYNVTNAKGLVDVGYTHKVSKVVSSSINATYNYFVSTHYIPLVEYKEDLIYRTSNDLLVEFTNYIKPAENLNIIVGALANMQSGWATQPELTANFENFDLTSGTNPDPHYQVPAYNETWGSAYLQADYRPVHFAKIIAGLQANKVTGLQTSIVPRLGTIFYLTKLLNAKVLYGQAFRSPAFFERYTVSLPGIVGNKNLSPELVGTFETQLAYTSSKYEMAVTYFNTKQRDLITRSNVKDSLYVTQYKGVPTSIPLYINRGSLTSQGVEIEGKANFTQRLSMVGSFAYQTNTNDNDRKDVYGTPITMTKLGLNYTHEKGFGIGIFNAYFGKGGDISTYNNGQLVTKQVNPQAKPYHYMTLNINADVFKLLNVPTNLQGVFNIYTNNLLNETIYYPEVVRRNMNTLPGRPGRGIYASFQLKF